MRPSGEDKAFKPRVCTMSEYRGDVKQADAGGKKARSGEDRRHPTTRHPCRHGGVHHGKAEPLETIRTRIPLLTCVTEGIVVKSLPRRRSGLCSRGCGARRASPIDYRPPRRIPARIWRQFSLDLPQSAIPYPDIQTLCRSSPTSSSPSCCKASDGPAPRNRHCEDTK